MEIHYRGEGINQTKEQLLSELSRLRHRVVDLEQRLANLLNGQPSDRQEALLYQTERQAREAAESANRIKNEFLAVLSHELRSPLNPILGWTKMLRSYQLGPEMTERALEAIERNAKLQAQLIEDLLDVSQILQGKLKLNIASVNLVDVIEAAIETMQHAAISKSIDLKFDWHPLMSLETSTDPSGANSPPDAKVEFEVAGDAARLQQVIWNLVSNAVKFTPPGGKVWVRLEKICNANFVPLPFSSARSDILSPPTPYAQITIHDTGKGIDPVFLPHIFEYFWQADSTITRQFGGLGLGLTIVRHLVELHGGSIHAESAGEGQGATFWVRLPLSQFQHATPSLSILNPQIPEKLMAMLQHSRVLVVDDDADMREFIGFVLRQAGAEVALASSVGEVLIKLSRFKPDVLISDIGMPDVDGCQLLRQIRSLMPELGGQVPAIALTAHGESNQQQLFAAGFQHHIVKPVEPEPLIKAVASLLPLDAVSDET